MNRQNADSLIKAGRQVQLPFQVSVVDDAGDRFDLVVLKLLRLLPRRRLVALAQRDGRPYLVKLFIGRMAGRYARREIAGVKAIESAGVKTPALEWQGRLQSGGGVILAFEYLEDAVSLFDCWTAETTRQGHQELMGKVIPVLAQLHESGVFQNDIHPENFLLKEGQLYTIDGGGIVTRTASPLNESRSLENLALFFAQFHHLNDDLVPSLLDDYRNSRGWSRKKGTGLTNDIHRHRGLRKKDFVQKAFRECTRFSCEKQFTRYTVFERKLDSPVLRKILLDPDAAMAGGEILKSGNTATVVKVPGDTVPLVIKRYNIKSTGHWLSRMFRKSRAWCSWENAMRLEFHGISSPNPVALIEERIGFLRKRAWFISEFIDGADATSLTEETASDEVLRSIVDVLQNLSAAGITHGDLKASNFLIKDERAVVLDLDSMMEHRNRKQQNAAEKRDRARFMKNWDDDPVLAERFSRLFANP